MKFEVLSVYQHIGFVKQRRNCQLYKVDLDGVHAKRFMSRMTTFERLEEY